MNLTIITYYKYLIIENFTNYLTINTKFAVVQVPKHNSVNAKEK